MIHKEAPPCSETYHVRHTYQEKKTVCLLSSTIQSQRQPYTPSLFLIPLTFAFPLFFLDNNKTGTSANNEDLFEMSDKAVLLQNLHCANLKMKCS